MIDTRSGGFNLLTGISFPVDLIDATLWAWSGERKIMTTKHDPQSPECVNGTREIT